MVRTVEAELEGSWVSAVRSSRSARLWRSSARTAHSSMNPGWAGAR
jgi:hypothetical protein